MSRGLGKLQRKLLGTLMFTNRKSQRSGEDPWISRRTLEATFVQQGHTPSNILRALRSLERENLVRIREGRTLDDSYVTCFPSEPFDGETVLAILRQIQDEGIQGGRNPAFRHAIDILPACPDGEKLNK